LTNANNKGTPPDYKAVLAAHDAGQLPDDPPAAPAKFETVFDVLSDLVNALEADTNAKFKPEIQKEVCYCFTNYCTTYDIHNIQQEYLKLLEPQAGSQHQQEITDLLHKLKQVTFPHYSQAQYQAVPQKFIKLTAMYLESSQIRAVDYALVPQLLDAAQRVLHFALQREQAGNPVPEGALRYEELRRLCQEQGFVQALDNVILRLHSTKAQTPHVKDCLVKCEAFRSQYFSDEEDQYGMSFNDGAAAGLGGGDIPPNGGQIFGGFGGFGGGGVPPPGAGSDDAHMQE